MSYLSRLQRRYIAELASEKAEDLYYIQPDGTWSKNCDGRSKGKKKSELPQGAEIAGYDNRIELLAQRTVDAHKAIPFKNRDELKKYIMTQIQREPEGKLAKADGGIHMAADVNRALKGRLRILNPSQIAKVKKEFVKKLAFLIQDAVGNSFPDGDPIDIILPKAKNLAGTMNLPIDLNDEIGDYCDKAVKTIGKFKNYNDYLKKTWQAFIDGSTDADLERLNMTRDNPWN